MKKNIYMKSRMVLDIKGYVGITKLDAKLEEQEMVKKAISFNGTSGTSHANRV